MKNFKLYHFFISFLFVSEIAAAQFRVVISSDFPPLDVCMSGCAADHTSDPDDIQSMVRFLLYANEFDIEGLIASSATFANVAKKQNIIDILNLYDKVDENLRKRDSLFPTADYLKSVTYQGRSGTWGNTVANNIGAGKDSEASNAIISIVDKTDTRPVWFCVWGDCSNIAQAIWKVQNTRSADELKAFLAKMRIYQIAQQDGTIDWLLENFPNLFIIYSKSTYYGIFGGPADPLGNQTWINKNIRQNHGPLGAVYPLAAMSVDGVKEGDSPSFMYLVSAANGMNDPENPTMQSWGGQYVRSGSTNHWIDGLGGSTISKWKKDYQAEFALRADWMLDSVPTSIQQPTDFKGLNKNKRIIVYPNPAKKEIKIQSEIEFSDIEIFNLNGKLVQKESFEYQSNTALVQLNCTGGIYILKVSNDKRFADSKILVI